MRNKKGQIGKIITSLPVMILIFIVIVLFVVAAAGIILLDRPSEAAALSSGDPSFLLMEVDVEGESMTVLDAYIRWREEGAELYDEEKYDLFNLSDSVEVLVTKNNDCLGLTWGREKNPATYSNTEIFSYFQEDSEPFTLGFGCPIGCEIEKYHDKALTSQISFLLDGEVVYMEYYYGRCMKE
jgi:hypothetical protein